MKENADCLQSCSKNWDNQRVGGVQWSYYRMEKNKSTESPYNATLAPQARQAKASGENLNYVTLASQARQARPSSEILN